MIPKIIHYCWFGPEDIPLNYKVNIENWKKICPDWDFILWNESNFDVNKNSFCRSAYEHNKFAFVSDYARVCILKNYGGIYLDVDVELKHPLDFFLNLEAFSCFECVGISFNSGVWGSVKSHSLLTNLLNYYDHNKYNENEEIPNTFIITNFLKEKFNIDVYNNVTQLGTDGSFSIKIFSSDFFCLNLPASFATHHFASSWIDNKENSYNSRIHSEYFISKMLDLEYNRNLTKYVANKISLKELVRLIYWFIKFRFL